MEITHKEAAALNQLVGKELLEGKKMLGLGTLKELQETAEENDLAHWKMLFELVERTSAAMLNADNTQQQRLQRTTEMPIKTPCPGCGADVSQNQNHSLGCTHSSSNDDE